MSTYGNEPPNPYGQQPPPPPPTGPPGAYGQQPAAYGAPGGYGGGYGTPAPPPGSYASWLQRVGAFLIDYIAGALASIPLGVGYGIALSGLSTTTDANGFTTATGSVNPVGVVIAIIGALIAIAFFVWNYFIRQGRTGYTIGKGVLGIKLIGEKTGQPIGAGLAFVRYLAHFVDSLICYIGWLFPLWDAKRQTIGDKIMSTVVVEQKA